MPAGTVVALHCTPGRRAAPEPVGEAVFRDDYGIEGDHHARAGRSRQVVLVEAEVLDTLDLRPGQTREQLTVRGLAGSLRAGAVLEIGTVRLELVRPRVPCAVMDEIRPGLERELRGRGGWCARVTAGGTVQAGDRVSVAYLNDSPCVVAFRAAMAEWEASSVDARRGVGLTAQLPGVIDDLQLAFGRICGSSTAVTPPEAGMASGNTLWEQHDEWSTAVLEGARTSPEAADDALADLIERYRMLAGA